MSQQAPILRSAAGGQLAEHAVAGELVLQQCEHCQAVQYPPREVCGSCLGEALQWRQQAGGGVLLAVSELHNSLEPCFKEALPWCLVSVQLDCGPVVLAGLDRAAAQGARVQVSLQQQTGGSWILEATTQTREIS